LSREDRAAQAHALVDDGLFAESLAKLEAHYIQKWRDATTTDEREDFHRRVCLIDEFRADMREVITSGDIAAKEAETQTKAPLKWFQN
jgi:hypothetical protein